MCAMPKELTFPKASDQCRKTLTLEPDKMHLLLGFLLLAKLSILSCAAPSLPSKSPIGLYLLLDANTSFSNFTIDS